MQDFRKACGIFVRCGDLCCRGLDSGLAGPPILSSRIGKRHPPCRGRAERGNPASAVSPHLGEILRRRPRNRLRTCARSRGAERADGGERCPPRRKSLPPQVARLQGAACGRCGCRPCHRVQRTDGGRGFRAGRACAAVRASYRGRGASATAIAVARVFLGDAPDFHVDALAYASAEATPLFFALGAVAGLAAIAYNRALLETITAAERLGRLSVELRAGLIGAAVGTLAWFAPSVVGGGDPITQRALVGAETLSVLPLLFLLRFGLGTVSYAAGTPGGLFAPMLALGAQLGLFFGLVCRLAFPGLDIQAEGFAVVGMAAFFTGVVRAPLTGIVLVTEMTANVTMLLPILVACFAAILVPSLLRDAPIYDSLREHTLRRERVLRQKTQKK